ncbi:hypothetical protein [Egicoccus sp. AB-alg6-2]|uniref:hypothetical protein n=1 Tax=Egicoccus sp. AB-alg6-2 TaxID=3242692 RepID=UPI00359ED700
MYPFVILVALALGLAVVVATIDELVPVRIPTALTRTVAVLLAAGLAWGLDYSVFAAFGQDLRVDWLHPLMTGVVLIATGEFVRTFVGAIASRNGDVTAPVGTSAGVRAA